MQPACRIGRGGVPFNTADIRGRQWSSGNGHGGKADGEGTLFSHKQSPPPPPSAPAASMPLAGSGT
jgi:hypothetical protein